MHEKKYYFPRRQFLTLSITLPLLGWLPGCSVSPVIRKLKGEVTVNAQPATLDTPVKSGDLIATGQHSEVFCVLGEDAYRLGENSRMQLNWPTESLWLRDSYADDSADVLRLLQGTLTSVFGKTQKQIKSPTAVIGIRGTGLCLHVGSESTYFCTCYGETEVTTSVGQHRLNATHHQAISIHHKTLSILSETKKYHGAADMYYLESLVGRKVPSTFR